LDPYYAHILMHVNVLLVNLLLDHDSSPSRTFGLLLRRDFSSKSPVAFSPSRTLKSVEALRTPGDPPKGLIGNSRFNRNT